MTSKAWFLRLALCLAVLPQTLSSQALDIGGIELRLGQQSATALTEIRSAYDVRYEESLKMWSVFRKRSGDDPYIWIGQLYVTDGVVTRIVKDYVVSDPYELMDAFTLAVRDVQKRGGVQCATRPREMTDDRFWGVITQCGPYDLTLNLPGRSTASGNRDGRIGGGVSITVPRWPSR